MPCFKPIEAWRKLGGGITFNPASPHSNGIPCKIPCGRCIGCRIERKQEWALRLSHEAKLHDRSCFVTLTYAPEFLPPGSTLVKRHVQLFIKRLRRSLKVRKIRYFACGEYGTHGDRPHYHLIIFGWEPDDGKKHSQRGAHTLYTSRTLDALWTDIDTGQPRGFTSWGYVTPAACSYVANYTTKKITGPKSVDHYTRITMDGEMISVLPEFAIMSTGRRSGEGIGGRFYGKYTSDFRNSDSAVIHGREQKIPRYYDKILKRENEAVLESIKDTRKKKARPYRANNTPERLADREIVTTAKLNLRKASL